MQDGDEISDGKLRFVTFVAWTGVILVAGWVAWCLVIPAGSLNVEAEIVGKRAEEHRGRRGRKYAHAYGRVHYVDRAGRTNTGEIPLFDDEDVGSKVLVRFQPEKPNRCQRADLRVLQGTATAAGVILTACILAIWLAARVRRLQRTTAYPFAETER